MRMTQLGIKTFRDAPKDAEIPSHQLLIRAGFIQKVGAGLYHFLPLGVRVLGKIKQIIREEHTAIGASEISLSVVTPGALWKESGRWDAMEGLMAKFEDRAGADMCLSPTNEESVTNLFSKTINSYKELPLSWYQINTKFRDEIRPRFGLMRAREFVMKDGYSFHVTQECLNNTYKDFYKAYSESFRRMGLTNVAVEADAGAMAEAGAQTHEFQVLAENGEDTIVHNPDYTKAYNIEMAVTRQPHQSKGRTAKAEEIPTPNESSIPTLAKRMGLAEDCYLKAYCGTYPIIEKGKEVGEKVFMTFILGDDEVNEVKLSKALRTNQWRPLDEKGFTHYKIQKGYIGPDDSREDIDLIFDQQVDPETAYIVGANLIDKHVDGFVLSQFKGSYRQADLRLTKAGDTFEDGSEVKLSRGIEVGHIFQLGNKYTKSSDTTVLDQAGKRVHPFMGCYGIGVTRILAAAVEQHHDEYGIKWPKPLAPFQIHFIAIGKTEQLRKKADDIYQHLVNAGIDVLFDDRKLSPGISFKDSDLIGIPVRLVLGEKRFMESGELEVKLRDNGESFNVAEPDLLDKIKEVL